MLSKVWSALSLGKRYVLASLIYVGLALIVLNAMPGTPVAQASGAACGGETLCPSGQSCCNGSCISSDNICCGDGSSGASGDCGCCAPEEGAPTTYMCLPPS